MASLPLAPHEVTVYPVSDFVELQVAKGRDKAAGQTARGSMQALPADYALRTLGFEVRNPHRFFTSAAEGSLFSPGYIVEYEGRAFAVRGVARRQSGLIPHAVVYLEELEVGLE